VRYFLPALWLAEKERGIGAVAAKTLECDIARLVYVIAHYYIDLGAPLC